MPQRTGIEWTDVTWNPTTGCTKISTGCKFCYAERWALMQQKRGISQYKNGFSLTLAENRLNEPYKWKESRMVFVNSMSDLFHEKVSVDYIKRVFEVINETPQHIYQILTKRSERMMTLSRKLDWPDNLWMGVSVENQHSTHRITHLKETAARIKFISFEPLLGEINSIDFNGIDWVIVGGESGGKARRVQPKWVHSLKATCDSYKIPFFFKQWGKRIFNPDPANDLTLNRNNPFFAKGGCMINQAIYRDFPETS